MHNTPLNLKSYFESVQYCKMYADHFIMNEKCYKILRNTIIAIQNHLNNFLQQKK